MMTESSEELGCEICFYKVDDDQPYCKIDNKRENGKYHIECLERWLQKSNNGLHTQDKIISYSVYHGTELIETIKVDQKLYNNGYSQLIATQVEDNAIRYAPITRTNNTMQNQNQLCCCALI
ncbi:zinc finger protein RING/FYVE/PHD-type protein [Fadolivirus algeromassiliense]|jgi:hypothetical protein|uniref:Zinc finger protein RING/FYVE/PHD-type protein n=1 Tax=Fadolivirus FV1/VV64 TaxID=3070911 RepID=A0A7D3QUK6_9VIRU|nr:zinc finger protein RING/FYVE/PHD-type protein [Fadolivirus algeromassiliense]QKF94203.1 zinc finger protein RING/FYVE/PHD-type protein [Fadolivirus FV1/VV64]